MVRTPDGCARPPPLRAPASAVPFPKPSVRRRFPRGPGQLQTVQSPWSSITLSFNLTFWAPEIGGFSDGWFLLTDRDCLLSDSCFLEDGGPWSRLPRRIVPAGWDCSPRSGRPGLCAAGDAPPRRDLLYGLLLWLSSEPLTLSLPWPRPQPPAGSPGPTSPPASALLSASLTFLPSLPGRQCGWCEPARGRSRYKRPGEGVGGPKATPGAQRGKRGGGAGLGPDSRPPASRFPTRSKPVLQGFTAPTLSLLSPSTPSLVFPEPEGGHK